MKRGKNYRESAKLIERGKQYEITEAMELVTKTSKAGLLLFLSLRHHLGISKSETDPNFP